MTSPRADFDLIVDRSDVEDAEARPGRVRVRAGHARRAAPDECVAVEDNLGGVQAATAAGVACIAFPNENTAEHDFSGADRRVERLDFADVQATIVDG